MHTSVDMHMGKHVELTAYHYVAKESYIGVFANPVTSNTSSPYFFFSSSSPIIYRTILQNHILPPRNQTRTTVIMPYDSYNNWYSYKNCGTTS